MCGCGNGVLQTSPLKWPSSKCSASPAWQNSRPAALLLPRGIGGAQRPAHGAVVTRVAWELGAGRRACMDSRCAAVMRAGCMQFATAVPIEQRSSWPTVQQRRPLRHRCCWGGRGVCHLRDSSGRWCQARFFWPGPPPVSLCARATRTDAPSRPPSTRMWRTLSGPSS